MTLIFKKGTRNKAKNYRQVSLISIFCEMLEHVITGQRIIDRLEKYGILTDAHRGFRIMGSC